MAHFLSILWSKDISYWHATGNISEHLVLNYPQTSYFLFKLFIIKLRQNRPALVDNTMHWIHKRECNIWLLQIPSLFGHVLHARRINVGLNCWPLDFKFPQLNDWAVTFNIDRNSNFLRTMFAICMIRAQRQRSFDRVLPTILFKRR